LETTFRPPPLSLAVGCRAGQPSLQRTRWGTVPVTDSPSRTRVAVYLRIARAGDGQLLARQVRDCEAFCEARNLVVAPSSTYIEVGQGHGVLDDLLREASSTSRRFNGVVLADLGQLSVGGIHRAVSTVRELVRAQLPFWCVGQPDCTSASANVMLSVLSSVDFSRRMRISRGTQDAWREHKEAARASGTPLRWGRPRGSTNRTTRRPGGERELP
jgi:hypothetical protein